MVCVTRAIEAKVASVSSVSSVPTIRAQEQLQFVIAATSCEWSGREKHTVPNHRCDCRPWSGGGRENARGDFLSFLSFPFLSFFFFFFFPFWR